MAGFAKSFLNKYDRKTQELIMNKLLEDIKKERARRLLNSGYPTSEVARIIGVSEATIVHWMENFYGTNR